MPCFTFYIFNRKGACQYYHEWQVGGGWVVWLAACAAQASGGFVSKRLRTSADAGGCWQPSKACTANLQPPQLTPCSG